MRLRMLPGLLGAIGVAVAVALVVPAGTAEAAQASASVTQTVSPGTADGGGSLIVPPSVLGTATGVPGGVDAALGGLIWDSDGQFSQSMMLDTFDKITSPGGTTVTNTGHGYATSYWCTEAFSVAVGSWGANVPRMVDVEKGNSYPTGLPAQDAFPYECGQSSEWVVCYNPTSSGSTLFQSVVSKAYPEVSGMQAATLTTPCAQAVSGSASIPVELVVNPTALAGTATIATDGGTFVNPDYSSLVGQMMTITTTKTCTNVSTGATQSVSASGGPGTGTVAGVACPAGTYTSGVKITAGLPGLANQSETLYQSSLASGAATAYADCITGSLGCALSVWLDGVECALGIPGCDDLDNIANTEPDRLGCKWGGYIMPVSDCQELQDCYGIPIDSVSSQSDPATGCGIDPNGDGGGHLVPIQDGHLVPTDGGSPSPSAPASSAPPTSPPPSQPTIVVSVNPTINVTVQPTINVNVPQSTVIVNVPSQGPVDIPQGQDGSDCWPSGTAKYNPLDWAYTPMHCALSKLLVPTPGKGEALINGIGKDQPFKAWTDAVSDMAGAFSVTAGDCQGPAVKLGPPLNMTIYPASACNEPQRTIARISRAGTGAVMIIGGLWSSLAAVLQGIGYQVRSGSDD